LEHCGFVNLYSRSSGPISKEIQVRSGTAVVLARNKCWRDFCT